MRYKLQKAVPMHIIVYLVINTAVIGISACLLVLLLFIKYIHYRHTILYVLFL